MKGLTSTQYPNPFVLSKCNLDSESFQYAELVKTKNLRTYHTGLPARTEIFPE